MNAGVAARAGNAIEVRHVSKYYTLSDSQWTRLRRIFSPVNPAAGSESGRPHAGDDLCALNDVSFEVAQGEALGIIGANGSGKSTLLQIVAGILRPTSGSVELNGRCSTLLELGSGFAPEFTGRQNVHLNATIMGLSQEEIEEKFDAIHRFSGIGDFIDQPIRTYSTGMVLRLAFAVVAHSEPRILIVDEALAVGDVAFRQRCMRRIHELRAAGVTILFVSHDAGDVKALCERCLWLERGVVRGLGEADEVVARYLASTLNSRQVAGAMTGTQTGAKADNVIARPVAGVEVKNERPHHVTGFAPGTHRFGNGAAEVTDVSLPSAGDVFLQTTVHAKDAIGSPIIGFLVRNGKGENIFGTNSAREDHPIPAMLPGDHHTIAFHLKMPILTPGQYSVTVAIADGHIEEYQMCDYIEDTISFEVAPGPRPVSGYLELHCENVAMHRN